jgi:menaquinone-dependent protoporphyrinogen oxidase
VKVLVTAASRHGATAEIAKQIAEILSLSTIEVDVRPPDQVETVAPYDAVVLGSGVYAGRWLEPARQLVEREREALAARPVWLFSSGPVGDPAKPAAEPVEVAAIARKTQAIDHRVFAGKLDRQQLGFGERAIVLAVHAAEGDFRPWEAVTDWALEIGRSLEAQFAEGAAR